MKPFVKVNDKEIISTTGPIKCVLFGENKTIFIYYFEGATIMFKDTEGSKRLWDYFSSHLRCDDLTI